MNAHFSIAYEHRKISNLAQHLPIIIKTLANLCQILDDYPLFPTKLQQIEQGTMDCILWNENQSYPIAIDQNKYLTDFRQLIREYLYEYLEFAQEMERKEEVQKTMTNLLTLNTYRIERQLAYQYFAQHPTCENALFRLKNIDQEQFHQLRILALYLRQDFLKLIKLLTPKLPILD